MRDETWKQHAACRGIDTSEFYLNIGDNTRTRTGAEAKLAQQRHPMKPVCWRCPVRVECLEYGLEERFGVWGGTTEAERRVIRRQRRQQAKAG